jgi:hypothetical protein
MLTLYHRQITLQALEGRMGRSAISAVIRANILQDGLQGQIGHPEYHFDDSQIEAANQYIASLRQQALVELGVLNAEGAWNAFGKLTHAAQDFYAHTTYIRIWREHQSDPTRLPEGNDFMLPEIMNDPNLISGRFYAPWEWITFIPWLGHLIGRAFPKDSHAYLNNDSPAASKFYPQVHQAAVLRTIYEYNQFIGLISDPNAITRFNQLDEQL